jgi:hypothetical protein
MIDLALIDLTPNSIAVIRLAHWWSTTAERPLHLLHDVKKVLPALTDQETQEAWFAMESTEARIKAQRMGDEAVGAQTFFPIHISRDRIMEQIELLHGRERLNVIFVGAKGTGFLDRVLKGSHIITLTEKFEIPIVAVPVGYEYRGKIDLHVAVSHHHPFDAASFLSFFKRHEALIRSVEFLSVDTDEADQVPNMALLATLAGECRLEIPVTSRSYQGRDPLSVFKEHLTGDPARMLIVQKGSRSWADQMFRKFLVNELVYDGSVPMIILP